MSDESDAQRLERALHALVAMQTKLEKATQATKEPIAVIGMACRFPGGCSSPDEYWRLLVEGRHGVIEVPEERWNIDAFYDADAEVPGKMTTRFGGFIGEVRDFDADFFGIAPREAESLDPQHRLALEVAWKALEDAGKANAALTGSRTGVYLGICSSDYSVHLMERATAEIDAYMATGNAHSTAAGRLSFCLGLEGPSLAVDTACSSSLVSVHLACRALRGGDCDMALAGGVNLLLAPEYTINFSKARMLAPDGFCKAFDAGADGFGRAEGCGFIVLKRLSDAQADGDPVLAVIRGSALNHDGRTSGLTVPNGPAQQSVIRAALADAGIEPDEVGYLEAHGTGTTLGDPIEMGALGAVFGKRERSAPLIVGSAKTNLGHLEGAAGIAGVIKVVLALQHRVIPPHLHFRTPSPHIRWNTTPVEIPVQSRDWNDRRVAGVSSFGFSGTNAHLVVSEAPGEHADDAPPTQLQPRPTHVLCLAARSELALSALAARYETHLETSEHEFADICYSANTGRTHFAHRLSVAAATREDARAKLAVWNASRRTGGTSKVPEGTHAGFSEGRPRIAFLFTGQGSQYAGMARGLYETQPVFRDHFDQCSQILEPVLGVSLPKLVFPDGNRERLNETANTQPALFALEYSLAQLWRSWGITPSIVAGHSVGEYVAACVAGIFSLDAGLRLIAERGRLMQALPRDGGMVAVLASEAQLAEEVAAHADEISIAAVNGPKSVVLSGRARTLDTLVARLEAHGVRSKRLAVSHAFHSPLMQPMQRDFERLASQVAFSTPRVPLVSNVTGDRADGALASATYWVDHIRQPVRFAESIQSLYREGVRTFLEIGPHPTLITMGQQCLGSSAQASLWVCSLRRERDDWGTLLATLGALYARGATINWEAFDAGYGRRRVQLPSYPFQRTRYWLARRSAPERHEFDDSSNLASDKTAPNKTIPDHPLLGRRTEKLASHPNELHWELRLDPDHLPFVGAYKVRDRVILPVSALSQAALTAGSQAFGGVECSVSELKQQTPLCVPAGGCHLQVSVELRGGRAEFRAFSRPIDVDAPWSLHATASLRARSSGINP